MFEILLESFFAVLDENYPQKLKEEYELKAKFLFPEFKSIANEVLKYTSDDETILLIGHSPSYLKPFLEKKRNVVSIAMSSFKRKDFDDKIKSQNNSLNICSYLKENIDFNKKISLIDISYEGDSIIAFLKLTQYCFNNDYEKDKINLFILQKDLSDKNRFEESLKKIIFYHSTNLIDYNQSKDCTDKINNKMNENTFFHHISFSQEFNVDKKAAENIKENLNEVKQEMFNQYFLIPVDILYLSLMAYNEKGFIPRYIPSYSYDLWENKPDFNSVELENGKNFLKILKELVDNI